MLPGRERKLVTTALMLGSLLAALEATAVAAAVPTAVGSMGGVSRYSWVFSAYLLTSTTTVPLYGKLADLYGRRRIYLIAVALFVGGSALSGFSGSLEQLIAFRAIQGLGAGGLMPVAATVIGDIFTLDERGRMQGLFAGVWAFASLVGPFVGGVLTDALSWRAIFFLGVPFGLLSAWMLNRHLREEPPRREHRLDLLGTVLLSLAVTLLLLGLIEGPEVWGWGDPRTLGTLAGSVVLTLAFLWQEHRAPEPMLPLDLFKSRVIAVSCAGNALVGALLFALTAFGPILGQGVLGGSATDAGVLLSPILIGWPLSSTITGRLMSRYSYRRFCLVGGFLLAGSGLALARLSAATTRLEVMAVLFAMGLGLGFVSMPYMIAVQSAVPWRLRGVATGSVQFFRSIGGAVGVAALGALFASRLTQAVGPGVDANALLDPGQRAAMGTFEIGRLSDAFLLALQAVFWGVGAIAVASLLVALWFPGGKPRDLAWVDPERTAEPAEPSIQPLEVPH